ncbi:MAG: Transposase protein [Cypionkella sp.]|nr:Transposase protein [Cypionkella sp.]
MMGRQEVQEALFYRFRIEDHVPADHLLRRIDWVLDFHAIRHEFEALYSHTGRPSVDPELMIRMLLTGYLYGIRSERRLVDEVHLNLAYRWFCRLGLEGRVPDRSTFSKNRHGRFADGNILRRVFEMVVDRCAAFGLVGGQAAAVDGSTIAADASRERKDQPEAMQKTCLQRKRSRARSAIISISWRRMRERSTKDHNIKPLNTCQKPIRRPGLSRMGPGVSVMRPII